MRRVGLRAFCARAPRHARFRNYPDAKNNMKGSGSNKFCLAVLGVEDRTSRRARAGEKGAQLARRPTLWEASRRG